MDVGKLIEQQTEAAELLSAALAKAVEQEDHEQRIRDLANATAVTIDKLATLSVL